MISDDFDRIDPNRWEKRQSKARSDGAAGNIKASHNQIETEDDATYLSLLASEDGEAGVSAIHPHRYGFTVCRWRVRGLDAEKAYAAHPAIWSFSYNMGVGRRNRPNDNGKTVEIDWFEYIKWERMFHARAIPAREGGSKIEESVYMLHGRTDFDGWRTWGFEYTPDHVRVWKHVDGAWELMGTPVAFTDTTDPDSHTLDRNYRSDQFFVLSNIWFYKPEYELSDVRLDIDFLHHYPMN
ncbi:MAG: hypothetical protein AAGI46_13090 [Planctomycetota bacterium]